MTYTLYTTTTNLSVSGTWDFEKEAKDTGPNNGGTSHSVGIPGGASFRSTWAYGYNRTAHTSATWPTTGWDAFIDVSTCGANCEIVYGWYRQNSTFTSQVAESTPGWANSTGFWGVTNQTWDSNTGGAATDRVLLVGHSYNFAGSTQSVGLYYDDTQTRAVVPLSTAITVNVGLVTETDTAQTQQITKKARAVGLAEEFDQARPSKWLIDVGQASETSFADRTIWIGAVEISPLLRTVWLNVASSQQDHMAFPNMSALSVAKVKPGSIRRMVGGKDKLFTHEGMQRAVQASFPGCTREQVKWLEEHVGMLLCCRDDRGRKLYGAYSQVEVEEISVTTAYAHCAVALGEVTHTEVV